MNFVSIVGFSAAALGMVAFFPQVLKVLKTKNTRDISLSSFSLVAATNFLWTVYGILRKDMPLTLANSVIFASVIIILLAKLRYK